MLCPLFYCFSFFFNRVSLIFQFRLALTKLDILDNFDEIKVATGYRIDGKSLKAPPCKSLAKLD